MGLVSDREERNKKLDEIMDDSIRDFQMTRRSREESGEWNDDEEATALREFFYRTERKSWEAFDD